MKKPQRPPELNAVMDSATDFQRILTGMGGPTHEGKYLHWDELRHRSAPHGLTHEQWWVGLKLNRLTLRKQIPLVDCDDVPFAYAITERTHELLHEIAQRGSGSIGVADQITNEATRNQYLVRSLAEEGITSSMIEGASTTRQEAKEMLRSKREPKGLGEQMVLNNYEAMQYIIDLGKTSLTPEIVLHLHEMITQDTLPDPSAAGRLRLPEERINVVDARDDEVLHVPPPAEQLPRRIEAMCDFANGKTPEGFVHPVVRSILLHFWLAYDHPFTDGNGRCARALFYWSMIQHDYWLSQFISISRIILRAPAQYARTFLYVESDDNDMTYFLLAQLEIVKKAMDELHRYLDEKMAQRRQLQRRLRLASVLNDRQLDVVAHALRHPDADYEIEQHQSKFGVVYQTARTDLLTLVDRELFSKRKVGKTWHFTPVEDMDRKLGELS